MLSARSFIAITALLSFGCSSAGPSAERGVDPWRRDIQASTPVVTATPVLPSGPRAVESRAPVAAAPVVRERAAPTPVTTSEPFGSKHPKGYRVARMSMAEARDWWPYPPVLQFVEPPAGEGEEVVLRLSEGDPSKQAGIAFTWQAGGDYEYYDAMRLVDEGEFVVEVQARPEFEMTPPPEERKQVTVRGRTAYLIETYRELHPLEMRSWRGKGKRDLRLIEWLVQEPNGQVVRWSVFANSRTLTEEQTISVVDRMREVWPAASSSGSG